MDSRSLAADELEDCRRLAAEWGLSWSTVATDEMERAAYRVNDGERCYHCKSALMDALTPLVTAGAVVALGVNVDDLGDHRPGQRAAGERDAVFPLVEAGFTKADMLRPAKEDPRAPGGVFERVGALLSDLLDQM